jgi:hypothetical protein
MVALLAPDAETLRFAGMAEVFQSEVSALKPSDIAKKPEAT